jgi:hypothetical protein
LAARATESRASLVTGRRHDDGDERRGEAGISNRNQRRGRRGRPELVASTDLLRVSRNPRASRGLGDLLRLAGRIHVELDPAAIAAKPPIGDERRGIHAASVVAEGALELDHLILPQPARSYDRIAVPEVLTGANLLPGRDTLCVTPSRANVEAPRLPRGSTRVWQDASP